MKRIVILGGGFGGLRAARKIAEELERQKLLSKYKVVLVDRNDHHAYTPLLYEVATTSKETAGIPELHRIATHNFTSLLKNLPVAFVQGEITKLDIINGDVHLADGRKMACEYVVLALGSETNYFGIAGLRENALTLKTFKDALQIRDAAWNLAMNDAKNILIVIGGGGPTSLELAGELKAWCGELETKFPKCRLDVTIIEANSSILSDFNPRLVATVKKRLASLGIRTYENETIAAAQKKKVILKNGRRMPYDILIWNGGTKPLDLLSSLPIKTAARGRIEVAGCMECLPQTPNLKFRQKIYALGDMVCVMHPKTKKPVPGVARAAISQANIVAHNIIEEIKKAEFKNYTLKIENYIPREYPYVIPVGGKYAVAKIGPVILSGFFAWILKGLVELNYLLSIMPLSRAIVIWFKGLKIFIQNDRLG